MVGSGWVWAAICEPGAAAAAVAAGQSSDTCCGQPAWLVSSSAVRLVAFDRLLVAGAGKLMTGALYCNMASEGDNRRAAEAGLASDYLRSATGWRAVRRWARPRYPGTRPLNRNCPQANAWITVTRLCECLQSEAAFHLWSTLYVYNRFAQHRFALIYNAWMTENRL